MMYQLKEGETEFKVTMTHNQVSAVSYVDQTQSAPVLLLGHRDGTHDQITVRFYCFQMYRSFMTLEEAKVLPHQCN